MEPIPKAEFSIVTRASAKEGLFNAGLDAKSTRAIDLSEGDKLHAAALKDLIRSAVAHNLSARAKK